MKLVADDVWQLAGFPPNAINVYLAADVVFDTATRWAGRRLLRQLSGHPISLVALTHCHPDHQGQAKALCDRFHVPLACHEADCPAMEGTGPMLPRTWPSRLSDRCWSGPPYPVGRVLRDGDEVAGFRVVHTPGHTPGHVVYFRERDRVAIAGDLLHSISFLTGRRGLYEAPAVFNVDTAQNRRSIRLLAELRPKVVLFGHGPPLHDLAKLDAFVDKLID
jgi:glyoxylase-like metal-dependent hydrolase (beta-lactamase superfamily II)